MTIALNLVLKSYTDLKITVSGTYQGRMELTCSSTCTLPNNSAFIWYKNGLPVSDQYSHVLYLTNKTVNAGSYSCAVKGYEELRSPAVCKNFSFVFTHSVINSLAASV